MSASDRRRNARCGAPWCAFGQASSTLRLGWSDSAARLPPELRVQRGNQPAAAVRYHQIHAPPLQVHAPPLQVAAEGRPGALALAQAQDLAETLAPDAGGDKALLAHPLLARTTGTITITITITITNG